MQTEQKNDQDNKAHPALLIGTRKGAFFLNHNVAEDSWSISGPHFLGAAVNHMVQDPRDKKSMLMAAHPGHLGPTIYRSTDYGITWKEASTPPAFPKTENGETVRHTFWLSPGHASEPDVWYAGTCPPALFRTSDGGDTWEGVSGFNDHPMRREWAAIGTEFEIPGGNILHSIQVDPRDANHIYFGISVGGVFETTDRGATWQPLNKGIVSYFLPEPEAEFGHDPHSLRIHPQNPDLLYLQTHTGIFFMQREEAVWRHVGAGMPAEVGDIGFPIVLHPHDPDTAWVFPMDGTEIWPRTSPGGKPAAYRTQDFGENWTRQDIGFPREHGYFSVKRQAMVADRQNPVGLYLGTTGGQIWGSFDEGQSWKKLADHLPEIFSLEAVLVS
ncbi:MAG: glycosyl hydrolase [Chloroflexi bacterium HGW-Chloroflexi-10]|nr:MAG: glycosyl hydrolase [Chloroflexi bacterium HGW-Chloroflexi-10]